MSLLISKVFTYDVDAGNYIQAVEVADGNVALEPATRQAINTYVQALKAGSIWTSAAQLLLPCGPRTLAGALVPLKGASPTNGTGSAGATQFDSSNYNRKNGLGDATNTARHLRSNVTTNALGSSSHALFCYGAISETTSLKWLAGGWTGTGNTLLDMLAWLLFGTSPTGRTFRSGADANQPVVTAATAVSCMIGSRTSSTSAVLYADSLTSTSATAATLTGTATNIYYYSLNNNGSAYGFSSAVLQSMGIFSVGLDATQAAALRSATAAYVAAISTAF